MRYVGIKNCIEKSTLVKYAAKKGKKVKLQLPSVTASDCKRHFEILKLFDKKADKSEFKQTEYYRFNKSNGKKPKDIFIKIDKFHKLYRSIHKNGYDYSRGYIVLSKDGARLDGSHRASIVEHLGHSEITVLIVKWEDLFKKKQLKDILQHLNNQKAKYL